MTTARIGRRQSSGYLIDSAMTPTMFRFRLEVPDNSARQFAALTRVDYETATAWGCPCTDGIGPVFPAWVEQMIAAWEPAECRSEPDAASTRLSFGAPWARHGAPSTRRRSCARGIRHSGAGGPDGPCQLGGPLIRATPPMRIDPGRAAFRSRNVACPASRAARISASLCLRSMMSA